MEYNEKEYAGFIDAFFGLPKFFLASLFRRIDKLLNKKSASSILHVGIFCFGSVGELLLASGLLRGIKNVYPKSETLLFTSTDNASACELIPNADVVYFIPEGRSLYTIKMLRRSHLDVLINTALTHKEGALLSAFSGATLTSGFSVGLGGLLYDKAYPYSLDKHIWENYIALLGAEIPKNTPSLNDPGELVSRLLPKRNFVICHMFGQGKYSSLCEWTPEKWAELAKTLSAKKLSVVFTGGIHDQGAVDEFINTHLPDTSFLLNLAGRLSLEEAAQLSLKAKAVVSVCSGFMHLASLCGAYTIGLFGPINPVRWGPAGHRSVVVTPKGATEFPPLRKIVPKDYPSLARYIEVEQVTTALEIALAADTNNI